MVSTKAVKKKSRWLDDLMLSTWRWEVIQRVPNCSPQSNLSLLFEVSSHRWNHFEDHNTRGGSRHIHHHFHPNVEAGMYEEFLKMTISGARTSSVMTPWLPVTCCSCPGVPLENGMVKRGVILMKHGQDPVINDVFEITPTTTSKRPCF